MAVIGVVTIGLVGHVGPATRLAAMLVRLGHEVHFWGPSRFEDQIEAAGARLHPSDPVPVDRIAGGVPGFAAMLADAAAANAEELTGSLLELDADLVVHDCHAPWGRVGAEFLGIPRVVSHPLFLADGSSTPDHVVRSAPALVPMLPPGWQQSAARYEASRRAVAARWGVDLGDWRRSPLTAGELMINYTTPEIAGLDEPSPEVRFVGALLDPPPPRRRSGDRPLVYVSLGTFFNFVRGAFRIVIDGLADQPVEVLISTGRGAIGPGDLGALPSNVTAREFVAAREVLARASAMVTHCGINSVHEALLAGVPMVCLPQGNDQFTGAERVRALGAGVVVEQSAGAIAEGVRTALADEGMGERARALGRRLASYDGARAVSQVSEEALTSSRSAPEREPSEQAASDSRV